MDKQYLAVKAMRGDVHAFFEFFRVVTSETEQNPLNYVPEPEREDVRSEAFVFAYVKYCRVRIGDLPCADYCDLRSLVAEGVADAKRKLDRDRKRLPKTESLRDDIAGSTRLSGLCELSVDDLCLMLRKSVTLLLRQATRMNGKREKDNCYEGIAVGLCLLSAIRRGTSLIRMNSDIVFRIRGKRLRLIVGDGKPRLNVSTVRALIGEQLGVSVWARLGLGAWPRQKSRSVDRGVELIQEILGKLRSMQGN